MATVFLSYRHELAAHRANVRIFGERLRAAGIKVLLDQFYLDANPGGPDEGWPAWSKSQAAKSEKVLIVGSPGWYRCYDGTEVPGSGLGAAVEGRVITQRIYNESGLNRIARLVVFDSAAKSGVPLDLQGYHSFHASDDFGNIVGWVMATLSATTQPALPIVTADQAREALAEAHRPTPDLTSDRATPALAPQRLTIREKSAAEIVGNLKGITLSYRFHKKVEELYLGRWTREPGWQATVYNLPSKLSGGLWYCSFREVGSGTLVTASTVRDVSTLRPGDSVTVGGRISDVSQLESVSLEDAIVRGENVPLP